MAKLSTHARKQLLDRTFGLPAQRKYPMPDRSHAANAKSRSSEEFKLGNLTAGQKAKIDRKADRILR